MNGITHITEDKIFETLGKGKDPNFKPVDVKSLPTNTEPFNMRKLLE